MSLEEELQQQKCINSAMQRKRRIKFKRNNNNNIDNDNCYTNNKNAAKAIEATSMSTATATTPMARSLRCSSDSSSRSNHQHRHCCRCSCCCKILNHTKWHNLKKFRNYNKLITTTLLLLITIIMPTMPTTMTRAANLPATSTLASTMGTGESSSTLSLKQQRELQQRQLFAMLSQSQTQIQAQPQQQEEQQQQRQEQQQQQRYGNVGPLSSLLLETSGFVADDAERYEKADPMLQAAAIAAAAAKSHGKNKLNGNSNAHAKGSGNGHGHESCPKECQCLNDYFDCGEKHLDSIPPLPNYVKTLDLGSNKLSTAGVMQLKNLSELNGLSLKRNQLEVMPVFVGLTELRQLNLANNRIQRVSQEALAALPKLKTLDLSRNYLHSIEANSFLPGNKLSNLILNGNEIGNIDERAFDHLLDLNNLELSNNRLTSLPAGVFKNLTRLKKLVLNFNHLEINWSTFRGLHSLQKLCLKSNNIRALQDGVFHVMRAIETIELDHNDIKSLSRQGLFNLTKLQHLSLTNNSISRIELDTWEFTQSLVYLDLSLNNISEFKPQHLDCLQRLRHLNLGHNKIQYLTESTFDCVKNLEELNLRRNRLAWIIEDPGAAPAFKALRKLKKLDLYGNNLKQINTKSLSGLSSLEMLNLKGNPLATIQSGAFDHMPHLQKVIFKSINFICDCELLWFRRWLQKSVNANPAQKVQENAQCGYPEHLLDRPVFSLTTGELTCIDSPKPVITQEPNPQLAVKGANISMECIATSPAAALLAATDELKIKWRHDNQNIRDRGMSGGGGHHHPHGHPHAHGGAFVSVGHIGYSSTETQVHHDKHSNQTTIKGYLHLYNVSYESAGRYQCVVSNAFGTTYSQKFKLSIGIHPKFLQIPSNVTIDSGDTARLVCSATGDPMPEIALQKFGAADFPAATERRLQVVREENAFIITNAKPMDTGIYTCTAESAAGEIKVNATLIVNDKPQPSIPSVRKETLVGQSSVLQCLSDLSSDLKAPLQRDWYKDNKPLHISSSTTQHERYYFTTGRELLVIVSTESGDAGHYRCDISDNSKTYTIPTELIVVKEDFNDFVIVVSIVIVACISAACLIVWSVLCWQKRKLYRAAPASGNGGLDAVASAGGIGPASVSLEGGQGHLLDATQMTTLNRTYLTEKQGQHDEQQRPRSLADLDLRMNGDALTIEQRNCLIARRSPQDKYLEVEEDGGDGDGEGGLTLDYLRRNSALNDSAEHNQDHLSSKDSGTGSDAAVKRSLDDFTQHDPETMHLMINSSTPAKLASLSRQAIRAGDGNDEPGLGTPSAEYGGDAMEMNELHPVPDERQRFLPQHNNHKRQPLILRGAEELDPPPADKCRSTTNSASITAAKPGHVALISPQAVDI